MSEAIVKTLAKTDLKWTEPNVNWLNWFTPDDGTTDDSYYWLPIPDWYQDLFFPYYYYFTVLDLLRCL